MTKADGPAVFLKTDDGEILRLAVMMHQDGLLRWQRGSTPDPPYHDCALDAGERPPHLAV